MIKKWSKQHRARFARTIAARSRKVAKNPTAFKAMKALRVQRRLLTAKINALKERVGATA